MKRKTIEEIQNEIDDKYGKNKYILLSKDYKNNKELLEFECLKHNYLISKSFSKFIKTNNNCPLCSLEIRKEAFLEKAKKTFPEYDYSLVNYINNSTKIKVICPIHGMFEAIPSMLLEKHKCPKCANTTKTTEQFIKEAKYIHRDKYDYSLVDYKNAHTKVKIICPIHGMFEQTPINHLKGNGCSKCSKVYVPTKEEFIERVRQIHGDKYDYSLVDYKNNNIKIKIICPVHGIFEQQPAAHLNGQGCHKCSIEKSKLTKEEFIERARQIHGNKYDYSLVNYKNNETKIKIICPIHNIFEQTPNSHLSGHGCKLCAYIFNKGENSIKNILQKNSIKFEQQKTFCDLRDILPLSYDFYLPNHNLLIEYNGRQHYEPVDYFGGYRSFLLQKHHDWLKRKYAQKNNIKLLVIPHWNFNNIETILKENL